MTLNKSKERILEEFRKQWRKDRDEIEGTGTDWELWWDIKLTQIAQEAIDAVRVKKSEDLCPDCPHDHYRQPIVEAEDKEREYLDE